MRPLDLVRERLVEVAAVVQPTERISHGKLVELPEPARVLDRAAGGERELLEAGQILFLRLFHRSPPEHGQGSGRGPVLGGERKQDAELNCVRPSGGLSGEPIADRQRARAALGRPAAEER